LPPPLSSLEATPSLTRSSRSPISPNTAPATPPSCALLPHHLLLNRIPSPLPSSPVNPRRAPPASPPPPLLALAPPFTASSFSVPRPVPIPGASSPHPPHSTPPSQRAPRPPRVAPGCLGHMRAGVGRRSPAAPICGPPSPTAESALGPRGPLGLPLSERSFPCWWPRAAQPRSGSYPAPNLRGKTRSFLRTVEQDLCRPGAAAHCSLSVSPLHF